MTRFPVALAAALAATAVMAPNMATAQSAPDVRTAQMSESDSPLLSFTVTEEVRADPDRANVGAGVTTQATTAVEAMRQNATQMAAMVRALRSAGIPERDIQTSGINLSPQYDYRPQEQGQPPRLIGYQVSNQVQVTTADIANLGRLLDALVAAGGTNLNGPSFSLADPDAGMDEARAAALRAAGERAAVYARAAGYRTARLVSLSEGGGHVPPPMPVMARMVAQDAAASTPVSPGQVARNLVLNVQYRLER